MTAAPDETLQNVGILAEFPYIGPQILGMNYMLGLCMVAEIFLPLALTFFFKPVSNISLDGYLDKG